MMPCTLAATTAVWVQLLVIRSCSHIQEQNRLQSHKSCLAPLQCGCCWAAAASWFQQNHLWAHMHTGRPDCTTGCILYLSQTLLRPLL